MSTETLNLEDIPAIPDLSGIADPTGSGSFEKFGPGWYAGEILESRTRTDKAGNESTFASDDLPSQSGDSRNIRLQVAVTRQSDKAVNHYSLRMNYRPEDLTAETVQQITAQMEQVKNGEQWGSLFRPFMVLNRLSKLQKIAGVRQLQRNGNGGLDLHPVFGKKGYFRLAPQKDKPEYLEIADFRETAPKKVL